jgi:hypothetical protein
MRGDLYEALRKAQRPLGEPDAASWRELLHAGRQVRGLPHGRVVHPQIAADRAYHDIARVDPDADLHFSALRAAKLIGVAPHDLLHPQSGIAGPHGVVFMGERRAKKSHDPVAHHLVDRALVVMDRFHHPFEDRIEYLASFFGVSVGEQLH